MFCIINPSSQVQQCAKTPHSLVDPASICIPRSSLTTARFSTNPRTSLPANRVDCQNQRIDANKQACNSRFGGIGSTPIHPRRRIIVTNKLQQGRIRLLAAATSQQRPESHARPMRPMQDVTAMTTRLATVTDVTTRRWTASTRRYQQDEPPCR
jgi:hypothetical protein